MIIIMIIILLILIIKKIQKIIHDNNFKKEIKINGKKKKITIINI